MTREEFEQCLIWSGFISDKCTDDDYYLNDIRVTVCNDNIRIIDLDKKNYDVIIPYKNSKEILELVTGVKLITEEPKPSIEEQLKDAKQGDFIEFKCRNGWLHKAIFISYDDCCFKYIDIDAFQGLEITSTIQEIISIKHNNFEEFNNE
jgi:hypothetical protein